MMISTDKIEPENLLIDGAARLGINLSAGEADAFMTYLEELLKWNERINLTAIRDRREVVLHHFLDSLTLMKGFDSLGGTLSTAPKGAPSSIEGRSLLDIGTGGGFPAIPLAIVNPGLRVTPVDSTEKKIHFLKHIVRVLKLNNVNPIHLRVEAGTAPKELSNSFDYVTTRAFASLDKVISMSGPYLKRGGAILAMKGPKGKEEAEESTGTAAHGGFGTPRTISVHIPGTERTTTIYILVKEG